MFMYFDIIIFTSTTCILQHAYILNLIHLICIVYDDTRVTYVSVENKTVIIISKEFVHVVYEK